MNSKIEIERSSGNVFADIGVANPEEALAKAEIARQINNILIGRKLSQSQAAEILGIDQPRVSALSKGRLSLFSLDKMMQFASRLGNEVEITIKPSPHRGIRVADITAPEQYVISNAVMGGQSITLSVVMNQSFMRQPSMRIDRSGMSAIVDDGELLVA